MADAGAIPSASILGRHVSGVGSMSRQILLGSIGFVIAIAAWWFVAAMDVGGKSVPSPAETLSAGQNMFAEQQLMLDIRISTTRILLGVAIGCGVALPVGYVLAWYPLLRSTFEPLVKDRKSVV